MSVERFPAFSASSDQPSAQWKRWLLLILILFAFARLTWQLESKNLWWDESLSLQRAESGWFDLLAGRIFISDRFTEQPTVDQHPFGYFVLLGFVVRLVGESEFVLRFPSVMASTLLLPVLWALARSFVRGGVLPAQTAPLVLFLAAGNPYYLWYGQEARMYTLVALLAVLSTYALLRWCQATGTRARRRALALYLVVTAAFLSTHYFAILLLPVHAIVLVGGTPHGRKWALFLISAGLLAAAGMVATAAWIILRQPHSGINFVAPSLSLLLPDLLNAYSLGLSVNIERVWWLDVGFGVLALLGGLWGVRRGAFRRWGWLTPACLIMPVLLMMLVSQIQPAYMNARHLGLISGFFLLLVAAGVGLIWQRHWLAGGLLCLLLTGAMAYSTRNYFTLPEYGKDDFAGVGNVLRTNMMPGDVLLLNPPHMQRLYRYYLPVDALSAAQAQGGAVNWWGMPIFFAWEKSENMLATLAGNYRRVWLVTSQMYPYADPQRQVESWLDRNGLRIRGQSFHSPNSILKLDLFLLGGAVAAEMPADAAVVQADFGGAIQLDGYRVGRPLWPDAVTPITFYWRALRNLDERYKYIASLTSVSGGQTGSSIQPTEREFYDGALPSIWWTPGTLIAEESELYAMWLPKGEDGTVTLQIYSSETMEKLPVISTKTEKIGDDGYSLQLPFPHFSPAFGATP